MFRVPFILVALLAFSQSAFAQPIAAATDISSVGSEVKETTYGDLAADALRTATASQIAFVPSSAFRSVDIPAAGMDTAQLASALVVTDSPSDGVIVTKLSGDQVIAALERGLSRLPAAFGGFLQFSGIRVVYSPNADQGSRVVSVTLADGTTVIPAGTYVVAMTKTLADGGMGYFQVWNGTLTVKLSQPSFDSLITTYATAHQPLTVHTDGRLIAQ